MDPLFACTKCHSRHLFEELSDGNQLCKNCRNTFPIVKCTYCRAEFQQEDKNGTSSICKKCAHNVKHHGKPKACEYCSVIAAFIGTKCQRCANSEKRYGAPLTCEQCKQQCAFDRQDDSRKKVDGKLLCWLCTMAYRRVIAKTKHKGTGTPSGLSGEARSGSAHNSPMSAASVPRLKTAASSGSLLSLASKNNSKHSSSSSSSSKNLLRSSSSSKLSSGSYSSSLTPQNRKGLESSGNSEKESSKSREREKEKSSSSSERQKHKSDSADSTTKESSETGPPTKKSKLEKTPNGITQPKSALDPLSDFSASENMVAVTQMREEIESLKKQLQSKETQILDRDKKITELKAEYYEFEKVMRNKFQVQQKQHIESLNNLQEKNRELSRQVGSLSKGSSKSSAS